MKLTVISGIYNEEYLLPFWLEHHRKIFDHGVIVDWHSTDRSLEIIREMCPTWEIRTTINSTFGADEIDQEQIIDLIIRAKRSTARKVIRRAYVKNRSRLA